MADFGIAEGIALAGVVAAAGTTVYSAEQASKDAKANRPQLPKPPPTLADESSLSDQRRKRMLSASGRDGTVLAPVGITGSPLGGAPSKLGA